MDAHERAAADGEMVTQRDVVIVGGGVVGCCAAFYLSREGLSVTVVERDAIASHASGFAYGGLTPVMGIYIDDPVVPLSDLADRLHAELAQELPAETGVDTEYRAKPGLLLATDDSDLEGMRAAHEWLLEHHPGEVEWLEDDDLRRAEPRLAPEIPAGMYMNISHEVEPYKFTLAMAQAAEAGGAEIVNTNVTGLVLEGGAVEGVQTEHEVLHTETVVLAAGPWTGATSEWLGFEVPIEPLKGQIIRLAAPGDPLELSVSWTGNYATTKPDDLLWAGTTEEHAGFDENPTSEGRDSIMESLVKVLPYLSEARLAQHTACLRPVAPDGLPVVGEVPGVAGAYVASGGGRKGILLGPGLGRVVADIVVGRSPAADVGRLGLDRFVSDGS